MTFTVLLAVFLAGSLHAKLYGRMPQAGLIAADVAIVAVTVVAGLLT